MADPPPTVHNPRAHAPDSGGVPLTNDNIDKSPKTTPEAVHIGNSKYKSGKNKSYPVEGNEDDDKDDGLSEEVSTGRGKTADQLRNTGLVAPLCSDITYAGHLDWDQTKLPKQETLGTDHVTTFIQIDSKGIRIEFKAGETTPEELDRIFGTSKRGVVNIMYVNINGLRRHMAEDLVSYLLDMIRRRNIDQVFFAEAHLKNDGFVRRYEEILRQATNCEWRVFMGDALWEKQQLQVLSLLKAVMAQLDRACSVDQ